MADLPHIEALLERQAKSWELRHALADAGTKRDKLLHLQEGPWLSISRQWGSGGVEIARAAGSRLGWEVYDRKILSTIAENTHTRETVLKNLDKRAVGPISDYISQLIVPGDPGRAAYLRELSRVIWGLAKQGQTVILGRGANWLLDSRFGLRVRVVAPLEQRVAHIARTEEIPEPEARRKLLEIDHDRKAFVQQVFGRDIDDPVGYDLMLNVECLTPEAASAVVLASLRAKLGSAG